MVKIIYGNIQYLISCTVEISLNFCLNLSLPLSSFLHFVYYLSVRLMGFPIYHATRLLYKYRLHERVHGKLSTRENQCRPRRSLRHRVTFRVTSGLIFWYVTLEAMWYMYNINPDVTRKPWGVMSPDCRLL